MLELSDLVKSNIAEILPRFLASKTALVDTESEVLLLVSCKCSC